MLALNARLLVMSMSIVFVGLGIVSIIVLLAMVRLSRAQREAPKVSEHGAMADYGLAISYLSHSTPMTVTVRRPRTPRPEVSSSKTDDKVEDSGPSRAVIQLTSLDESAKTVDNERSVQRLLDYLKTELSRKAV